ncbi:MAG: L,D-transpeptidase [Candidatus Kapaibacterium sp.]
MLDSIRTVFRFAESFDSSKVIALLNRKELRFMRVGDTLILPSKIETDARAYSLFPQYYPGAADVPRLVIVSNRYQCYGCYEYGELVRFAACNSGTKGKPTFPGLYFVNWRQRERISSLNEEWILPYTVNFHRYAGSAFHQFDMPGRPVSHSCIRQFLDDAKWLYSWVKTPRKGVKGTPIIIVGMFDYTRRRGGPWWDLASNKAAVISLPDKPLETEEALIPYSQIPKDVRGGLPDKERYLHAQDTLLARGVIDSTFKLRESIDYNKLRAQKKARKAKMQADSTKPSSFGSPSSEPHG